MYGQNRIVSGLVRPFSSLYSLQDTVERRLTMTTTTMRHHLVAYSSSLL